MNTILLQPTDVLFFRDGRPMSGSLAGHTAAWPMPDMLNHAFHAALHRADLEGQTGRKVHPHRHILRNGDVLGGNDNRPRKFGSLQSAGPFPVRIRKGDDGQPPEMLWFFPRPKDAQKDGSVQVTLMPVSPSAPEQIDLWSGSSLPDPLRYAVGSAVPPSKDAGGEPWISLDAFDAYLGRSPSGQPEFLTDSAIADHEANLGIAIDPETQTAGQGSAEGKIYTANYLRLRENCRLGMFAEALDKINGDPENRRDLIQLLLNGHPTRIVVGGQQRVCTAELKRVQPLPLPKGLSAPEDFHEVREGKYGVKWVLLSPAVWPEIPPKKKDGTPQNPHPGGWLPNWVYLNWDPEKQQPRKDERNGSVLLTSGPGVRKAERGRHKRSEPGGPIAARLVAAIVPKAIPVTGWALPSDFNPDLGAGGAAKSTHLAVPAGAVYYFEAESREAAVALANALNWHGKTDRTAIVNRRSTLLGEKGYGLGVCGTWRPFDLVR